jgi:hypothetical protein
MLQTLRPTAGSLGSDRHFCNHKRAGKRLDDRDDGLGVGGVEINVMPVFGVQFGTEVDLGLAGGSGISGSSSAALCGRAAYRVLHQTSLQPIPVNVALSLDGRRDLRTR